MIVIHWMYADGSLHVSKFNSNEEAISWFDKDLWRAIVSIADDEQSVMTLSKDRASLRKIIESAKTTQEIYKTVVPELPMAYEQSIEEEERLSTILKELDNYQLHTLFTNKSGRYWFGNTNKTERFIQLCKKFKWEVFTISDTIPLFNVSSSRCRELVNYWQRMGWINNVQVPTEQQRARTQYYFQLNWRTDIVSGNFQSIWVHFSSKYGTGLKCFSNELDAMNWIRKFISKSDVVTKIVTEREYPSLNMNGKEAFELIKSMCK